MSHYTHLTIDEREKAMVMRERGEKQAKIARELGRSRATISREFARNTGKNGYSAHAAQKKYQRRKKRCGVKRIFANSKLAAYVEERLNLQWSPEQIEGRARLEGYPIPFSFVSIYRAVEARVLPISLHKQMRIKSKKRSRKTDD